MEDGPWKIADVGLNGQERSADDPEFVPSWMSGARGKVEGGHADQNKL